MKRIHMIQAAVAASLLVSMYAVPGYAQLTEAPPIVIRSNTQESTIWAQDRVGAPVANGTQTIQSTTGAGTTTGTVNATGANAVLSTTQVAQPSSVVVAGDQPCESEPKTWDGTCQATLPKTFSGQSLTATANAPHAGSATFACQAGAWQAPTAVSCQTYCAPATVAWGSCSGTAGAQMEGQSQTVGNATGGFTGSGSFSCTATGAFSYLGGSCSAVAPPPRFIYGVAICTSQGKHYGQCGSYTLLCSYGPPSTGAYAVAYRKDGGSGSPEWDGAQYCVSYLTGRARISRYSDPHHQQWTLGTSANNIPACTCVTGGNYWLATRASY